MKQVVSGLLALFLYTSCVETAQNQTDDTDFSVVIHTSYEPNGLHPVNDFSSMRSHIYLYTHRPLLKINLETFDLEPLLVTEPPTTEDGLKYLYTLRNDVTWDDGSPFTLQDVLFTVKMNLHPLANNPALKPLYGSVIAGLEAHPDDENKFYLICKEMHAGNNQILTEANILQKTAWDSIGIFDTVTLASILDDSFQRSDEVNSFFERFNDPSNQFEPTKINGLGPYQLTEWEKGQYLTLEKKINWYDSGKAGTYNQNNPEKIVFRIIKDDNATLLAFRNQQVDVSNRLGTDELLRLQENEYFNAQYNSAFVDQFAYSYMGMNCRPTRHQRTPYFTDPLVRRAMAHATPVKSGIEDLLHGKGATEQITMVSALKTKEYNDTLPFLEYDLNKSNELLTLAGWIDTDNDGIRDKSIDGEITPFSFQLNYISGNQSTEDMCLLMKESYAQIGVDCQLNALDFSAFYKEAYDQNFDALMGAWSESAGYTDPLQLWHTSSWTSSGSNFCGFGNDYSDSLITQYNREMNETERYNYIKALQAEVYDFQPYVFLYSTRRKVAMHKRFTNQTVYNERPGIVVSEFTLDPKYVSTVSTPETTE